MQLRSKIVFFFILLIIVEYGCGLEEIDSDIQFFLAPTNYDLNSIIEVDDSTLMICGGRTWEHGVIYRTRDFIDWQMDSIGDKSLLNIYRTENGNVIVGGIDRNLRQFTQEMQWVNGLNLMETGGPAIINAICQARDEIIVVGGKSYNHGRIFHIGEDYNLDSTVVLINQLNDVDAFENFVLAVGYGQVLKYDLNSKSWISQEVFGDNFSSVYILSKNEAWITGFDGSIVRTVDGGDSWKWLQGTDGFLNKSESLNDIYFIDTNNGIAVGDNGVILKTSDGGENWQRLKNDLENDLNAILHLNGYYYIVGDEGSILKITV